MRTVINKNGVSIDYEQAVMLMNEDIMYDLHMEITPCSYQDFFTAYENMHQSTFNEVWELSKENPVY